jgi:hypothetical protein
MVTFIQPYQRINQAPKARLPIFSAARDAAEAMCSNVFPTSRQGTACAIRQSLYNDM